MAVPCVRPWPSLAVTGRCWPPLAVSGRAWPSLAVRGSPWPSVAAPGRPWPALAAPGPSPLIVLGRLWLLRGRPWRPWPSLGVRAPPDAKARLQLLLTEEMLHRFSSVENTLVLEESRLPLPPSIILRASYDPHGSKAKGGNGASTRRAVNVIEGEGRSTVTTRQRSLFSRAHTRTQIDATFPPPVASFGRFYARTNYTSMLSKHIYIVTHEIIYID